MLLLLFEYTVVVVCCEFDEDCPPGLLPPNPTTIFPLFTLLFTFPLFWLLLMFTLFCPELVVVAVVVVVELEPPEIAPEELTLWPTPPGLMICTSAVHGYFPTLTK